MIIFYVITFIFICLIILSRFINVEVYVNTETVDDEKDEKTIRKLKRILDNNEALKDYFKNNNKLKAVYYDLYPDEKESEKKLFKDNSNKEVSR